MNNIELLTVDEVAALLRISRDSTYQLVRSGAIRSFRVGRLIRLEKVDVLAFMERQHELSSTH